jgi:hypothetical protein
MSQCLAKQFSAVCGRSGAVQVAFAVVVSGWAWIYFEVFTGCYCALFTISLGESQVAWFWSQWHSCPS